MKFHTFILSTLLLSATLLFTTTSILAEENQEADFFIKGSDFAIQYIEIENNEDTLEADFHITANEYAEERETRKANNNANNILANLF